MKKIKKLLLTVLLLIGIITQQVTPALAETGSSGEGSGSESSNANRTHEGVFNTSLFGVRVYLVPTTELFGDSKEKESVILGSTYEDFAPRSVYCLWATDYSSGDITAVSESTKFAFNSKNTKTNTVSDFTSLVRRASDKFTSMDNLDVYNQSSKSCEFLDVLINSKSTTTSKKVKGVGGSSGQTESCLFTKDGIKYYTDSKVSIALRNWAVSDGNEDFFSEIYAEDGTWTKNTSKPMEYLIQTLVDYICSSYGNSGLGDILNKCNKEEGKVYDDSTPVSVVIEPVFGYYNFTEKWNNNDILSIMSASQYARWSLGMENNSDFSKGIGIAKAYDYASSSNIDGKSKDASYVYGRTTASNYTQNYSLTCFNFFSTLRPYKKLNQGSTRGKRLSDYGGYAVVYGNNSKKTLSLSLFTDFVYEMSNIDGLTAKINRYGGSYNVVDADIFSSTVGSESNYIENANSQKYLKGKASILDNTNLGYYTTKNNPDFKLATAYTFLIEVGNDYSESDITEFYKEYKDFKGNSESEIDIGSTLSMNINRAISDDMMSKIKITNNGIVDYLFLPVENKKYSSDNYETALAEQIKSAIVSSGISKVDIKDIRHTSNKVLVKSTLDKNGKVNYDISDLRKLTSQYNGSLSVTTTQLSEKGKKVNLYKASGVIPVTVAVFQNVPEARAYLKYIELDKKGNISDSSTGQAWVSSSISLDFGVTAWFDDLKTSGYNYYLVTMDNYTSSYGGKETYIEPDISDSLALYTSYNSGEKLVSDLLSIIKDKGKYNSSTGEIESIPSAISAINSKFGFKESNSAKIYKIASIESERVDIDYKYNKSTDKFYSEQYILLAFETDGSEEINSNDSSGGSNSFSGNMKEFELNQLENFYSEPSIILEKKANASESPSSYGLSGSNPTYYTNTVTGQPSKSPVLGDYDIQTELYNKSGLGIAYTWNSVKNKTTSNYNGSTSSISTNHYLYVISRAKLGDKRTIADFSYFNRSKYPASSNVNGSTVKNTLSTLGNTYGVVPNKDKTESSGGTTNKNMSGTAQQTVKTASNTGWKVNIGFDKYTWGETPSPELVTPAEYDKNGKLIKEAVYKTIYIPWSNYIYNAVSKSKTIDTRFLFSSNDTIRQYAVKYAMSSFVSTKNNDSAIVNKSGVSANYGGENGLGTQAIIEPEYNTILGSYEFSDVSNETLKIYPEVKMLYYLPSNRNIGFSGTSVDSSSWKALGSAYQGGSNGYTGVNTSSDIVSTISKTPNYIYTVGEKAREFHPTSYFLMEVYGSDNKISKVRNTDITGEVHSSALSTSSNVYDMLSQLGVDSNTPVILSGGDLQVGVSSNIGVELTTYAVDIAGKGDGVKSDTTGEEINLKSKWSSINSSDYSAYSTHSSYVSSALNSITQGLNIVVGAESGIVDTELQAQVGENILNTKTETDVYHIYIENGKVVNKDDIISEIAKDIKDESKKLISNSDASSIAERVYEGLNIESEIISKLETRYSSTNSSEVVTGEKWYDESSTSLVIKKYITNIKVGSVSASDKIDITWGSSMDIGENSNQSNTLYASGYKAGIKYTLGLAGNQIMLPSGNVVGVYQPLLRGMLDNCNFVIPDASVNDIKY